VQVSRSRTSRPQLTTVSLCSKSGAGPVSDDAATVERLLALGTNPNAHSQTHGESALGLAAELNHIASVRQAVMQWHVCRPCSEHMRWPVRSIANYSGQSIVGRRRKNHGDRPRRMDAGYASRGQRPSRGVAARFNRSAQRPIVLTRCTHSLVDLPQNRQRRRCWTTAPIRRRRRALVPPARRRSCWRRLAATRFV